MKNFKMTWIPYYVIATPQFLYVKKQLLWTLPGIPGNKGIFTRVTLLLILFNLCVDVETKSRYGYSFATQVDQECSTLYRWYSYNQNK